MRILICPDSYKGSADARSVAHAIEQGVSRAISCVSTEMLPMADGGEGSAAIISEALGGQDVRITVTGPYFERVEANYCISEDVAYIEMAEASGLCLSDRRECEYATTYGTGEMMVDAQRRGVKSIVVFIGGSATCDGGMGMAAALGYRFYSADGELLPPIGRNMQKVVSILRPSVDVLSDITVSCACDVSNVMYGEMGAAQVFARQKGADDHAVLELDRGLKNLADVIERELGVDVHTLLGGGAAGGLGAGLYAFAGAEMLSGFSVISKALSLEKKICDSDIVITGEGCTDSQSMMGKVVGNIAQLCRKHSKKCIVISGIVRDIDSLPCVGIHSAYQSSSYAPSISESIRDACEFIELAAEDAVREFI